MENRVLSKYACKDSNAIYFKDNEKLYMPPFFSDTDKIVNSIEFTRYMGKPQVYTNSFMDHLSNRMIHAQLVNRVGRSISRRLALNEDLIEAAALGHDLGHVPLGHEGEYILNDISLKVGLGYFNHNVESVRLLMYLANHGNGLNVSVQVLDAILSHNSKNSKEVFEPDFNKSSLQFLREYEASYFDKNVLKIIRPMTLEGCVLRVSDLIAYLGRDLDDAQRYGIFSWDEVPEDIKRILGYSKEELVRTCVNDIYKNSLNKPYIAFSDKVYEALMKLLAVNTKNIYHNYLKPGEKEEMENMFNTMFYEYLNDLKNNNLDSLVVKYYYSMSLEYRKSNSIERVVIDYIAGMTSKYFMEQYEGIARTRKL